MNMFLLSLCKIRCHLRIYVIHLWDTHKSRYDVWGATPFESPQERAHPPPGLPPVGAPQCCHGPWTHSFLQGRKQPLSCIFENTHNSLGSSRSMIWLLILSFEGTMCGYFDGFHKIIILMWYCCNRFSPHWAPRVVSAEILKQWVRTDVI